MKIYTILFCIIYFVTVGSVISNAQNTNCCEVIFQIQINTNIFKIGQSAQLVCQVKNISTNISFNVDANPLTPAALLLIDSAGKTYIPPGLHSPSLDQSFYFPEYYHIEPTKSCQWTLMFTLDKSVPPGNYEIIARHTVYVSNANYFSKFGTATNLFGKGCQLKSNSLRVEIK
jgi:hypothetical protein